MASTAPTQLPAYIQLRYEENGVFDKFESAAEYAADRAKKRFDKAFAETEKAVSGAVSRMSTEFGKLDLGVGDMRQQAAEIRLYRDTLQQVSIEAQRLAKETGDTSAATREYLRALQTQRSEASRALQVAEAQITTYSRLQSALDGSTAANDRLAQSQRALYTEQARAAQAEIAARDRQNLYAVGFGYDTKATSNGASFSALADREAMDELRRAELGLAESSRLLQATYAGTALAFDHTAKSARDSAAAFMEAQRAQDALDEMRRAEVGLAESARILTATHQGTALAFDHTTKSARESAAVFEQVERETQQMAAAVDRLHAELDPVVAATQRYAADVKILDQALAAGAISEERHAAMMVKVNEASRDGTTAFRSVINSSGAVRVALLQSGQQMQDFAIQVYSGQSATVAMAQQLPQLAFALSGLEGNTNKTYDQIGRFATFLSGPWGLAVGLGVGVLGTLAVELLGAGNEAEKATGKTYDFSRSIDVLRLSAVSTAEAMKQLADATKSAITQQGDFLNQQATTAASAVTTIQARITANQAELRKEMELMGSFTVDAGEVYRRITRQKQLRDAIKTDQAALTDARQAANNAELALSQRRVADSLDASTAATNAYNVAVGKLNALRSQSKDLETSGDPLAIATSRTEYVSSSEYEKRLTELTKTRDAAIKAAADAKKAANEVDRQFGREINLDAAKSIASSAGFRVTSAFRTRAEQQRLYDTVRTPTNPVALPGTSAHEKGNALDIAFGNGVSPASIKKAYAEAGVRLTKLLKEDGHFHIEWSTKGADKAVREAEAVARAQQQLEEFGQRSAESIARINERFDEQPRLIDQTSQAARQLDAIIADLADRKPPGFEQMIADAKEAKETIEDALVRPFREMVEDSERRLQVQTLLSQGRADEAAAVQEIWRFEDANYKLTDAQKDAVRDLVSEEQRRTRELERQRGLFEAQLDVLDQAKRSLTDLLSGRSTNFFKDMTQAIKDLQGKRLFDQIFGDVFQDLEDELRGQSPLGRESRRFADELSTATEAVKKFAADIGSAGTTAANDNPGSVTAGSADFNRAFGSILSGTTVGWTGQPNPPGAPSATGGADGEVIEVVAKRPTDIANRSIIEIADKIAGGIVSPFEKILGDTFGTGFAQMLGGVMKGALSGYMTGGTTGGIIGGLKGIVDQTGIFGGAGGGVSGALGQAGAGAATGTQIAGLSKALGLKTSTTGAQIGGAVGSFVPIPGGEIIGSVIGGLIGGLFKGNRTANAVLTNGDSYTQGGKDKGNYGTVGGLGDSVLEGLNNVVDQLGGTIGNFMVSIGTRGDEYRVNPNGTSLKLDKGAISFGDDAEAAIAFAIKNAIEDGAIKGMRASTLNIIKAGDDLEKALDDAVTWENAFKELRKYKDPLGAAMDDLDDEFERLIEISKTAGASAEEMADLEELYGIKRNEIIKEQAEALVGSLTSLYKDLTTGDNGLSLRDRRAAALTDYDALSARVKAGDTTAYDDYADAAQQLLDIERELYGSQQQYFDRLNEVTDLTKTRIDAETNVTSIAENRDSPFDASGAVKSSIETQTETLAAKLDANNLNQGQIIALLSQIASGGGASASAAARLAFKSDF